MNSGQVNVYINQMKFDPRSPDLIICSICPLSHPSLYYFAISLIKTYNNISPSNLSIMLARIVVVIHGGNFGDIYSIRMAISRCRDKCSHRLHRDGCSYWDLRMLKNLWPPLLAYIYSRIY